MTYKILILPWGMLVFLHDVESKPFLIAIRIWGERWVEKERSQWPAIQ